MNSISLTQPDDFHLHLRDGASLASVVGDSARQFARAMIMPNLKTPVTTVEMANAYRQRILANIPENTDFQPRMNLYLTDNTSARESSALSEHEHVYAVK